MAPEHQRPPAPPPPFPPVPGGPRKLVRRPDEGPVAGVCAGVAEYFHVDPMIVRIAAVALVVTGAGFPLLAYVAAWIFVPAADGSMLVERVTPIPEDKTTQVIGVALIVFAATIVFGGWWSPAREWLWPLALVGVGAWLLLRRKDDDGLPAPPADDAPPGGPAAPWAAPVPTGSVPAPPDAPTDAPTDEPGAGAPAAGDDAAAAHGGSTDLADAPAEGDAPEGGPDGDQDGPDAADGTGAGAAPPSDGDPTTVFAPIPPVPPVPPLPPGPPPPGWAPTGARRGRFLGPLVFGALLVWGGLAWLLGVEVRDALAISLSIIGAGFVLGAFVGGSKALILPAVVVAAALFATGLVEIPWRGGIGERAWEVRRPAEVDGPYEVAIGKGTLDLGELRVPAGRTQRIEAALGIGELIVVVPRGTDLDISAEIGGGEAQVLGRDEHGMDVEVDRRVEGGSSQGDLELDLQVGLGHLEVRYAA